MNSNVRAIAFHLPQFHPIPENDIWWGRGFTEWTNSVNARRQFKGHYQPHLPADLGFYDLRLPESRAAQAELADEYGLYGFCYYHYWFSGRRILERPLNEILASGVPRLPFCICWANESWSRRWLGEERDVLLAQEYSASDDVTHGRWLAETFADERYIRHHGRPLFLVWRPQHLPEPRATLDRIANVVEREGLPRPFFMGVDSHCPGTDTRKLGFDATMTFAPQLGALPGALTDGWSKRRFARNVRRGVWDGRLKIYDYDEVVLSLKTLRKGGRAAPCAFVGWDNTPRRGINGVIVTGGGPKSFARDFADCVRLAREWDPEEPLVFINAWNEWAEGCHLEPDQKWGRQYLEQVRDVMVQEKAVSEACPCPR